MPNWGDWKDYWKNQRSSGYRLLEAKIDAYERIAARASAPHPDLVDRARKFLTGPSWNLGGSTAAWARVHEFRHQLCMHANADDLLGTVLVDVESDVTYLDADSAAVASEKLATLRAGLETVVSGIVNDGQRRLLYGLSAKTAQARENTWLKANMTRNRLLIMGAILLGLLVTALCLLPTVLPSRANDGFAFIVCTALLGGMGGTISGLIGREPSSTPEADYYQQRRVILLRPVTGAVLGLVAFLASRFDILSVFNVNHDSPPGAFLAVAFIAGFGERLFLQRMLPAK